MIAKEQYLNFKDLNGEIRDFYKDFEKIKNFDEKGKSVFFRDKLATLSLLINNLNMNRELSVNDLQMRYSIFGVAYELLIKLCVLKFDWNNYTANYQGNHRFQYAREQLIRNLQTKLNPEQCERADNILEYVQIQRNNFVHSPFKGFDHYAVLDELCLLMLVLLKIYEFEIDELAHKFLLSNIKTQQERCGLFFKDVGFAKYVA